MAKPMNEADAKRWIKEHQCGALTECFYCQAKGFLEGYSQARGEVLESKEVKELVKSSTELLEDLCSQESKSLIRRDIGFLQDALIYFEQFKKQMQER